MIRNLKWQTLVTSIFSALISLSVLIMVLGFRIHIINTVFTLSFIFFYILMTFLLLSFSKYFSENKSLKILSFISFGSSALCSLYYIFTPQFIDVILQLVSNNEEVTSLLIAILLLLLNTLIILFFIGLAIHKNIYKTIAIMSIIYVCSQFAVSSFSLINSKLDLMRFITNAALSALLFTMFIYFKNKGTIIKQ